MRPTATLPNSVAEQRRVNARSWAVMYLAVLATSGVLGMLALKSVPRLFALPFTMLFLASIVVTFKPKFGLYLVAFFTLFTDGAVTSWFPFAKNMSSRESILYVSDSVILTPLEVVLAVTTVAWLLRLCIDRASPRFVRGGLFRPVVVFSGFLLFGIVLGLATGGDRYAAIWEFRPILYMPVLYVLATNLLTSRRDYRLLFTVMLVAVLAHAALALDKWSGMTTSQREAVTSLVDHSSAIQLGAVLMLAAAAWVLPKVAGATRWLLLLAAIPAGWVWFVSERRAAVVGLIVSVLFLGVLLRRLDPKRLRMIAPVALLLGLAYLGAFWRSESTLGFPAQAMKTVIAPGQASERDRSSDAYRDIENYDISATIRAKPITGLGFGHRFHRPIPLPDISVFPFHEYIPHNSVLWIWIKLGIGGFVAMLFLFGSAIRQGVRSLLDLGRGSDALLVFAASGYLVMYLVFAYVDVGWDTRSMVCVGIAMATCANYVRLPASESLPTAAHPTRSSATPTLAGAHA
jgi:O-antigen ligase